MVPVGTRLGSFRIIALLGTGGMGEVYRARDERLQRDVAVKIFLSRDDKASGTVDRFVREAQAASALNHPNIVTIHEVGESDVGRFIVMELVEGRTLRDLMGQPMPVHSMVQLGTQMARALAAAHAAGITHRDIKPENIMVRDDGYVKVLDFGLARLSPLAATGPDAVNRTQDVTEAGIVVGTLRYMSPEQAGGGEVGPASDLFSLGLIFYELLTGRHPFAAESGLATLNALAYKRALSLFHLNPEVPPTLDALILRMLEKEPLTRPSTAVVASALVDIIGSSVHVAAPTRPVERRVVGRARERAQLMAAFESAVEGCGLVLCVTGEPGLGKTTLVEDFLDEIRGSTRPCWTARGRCSERLAGTEAYLPLLEALDSMLHSSRLTWSASATDPGESAASLLKLLAPAWYAQVAPLAAGGPADNRAAPAASQEQMKRELISFFQELSRIRPFVLFLDDIHWADVSTTDLLAYLAVRLPTMPMLVLATYRQSDLLLAKHTFIPIKLDLQSRGMIREVALDFLTHDDLQRLLAMQFADHQFPREFGELIHTKTEGNPLFIVNLLHDLRSRQVITESRGRWTLAAAIPAIEQELPESVRSMIRRKIEQLAEPDRRLLVAASVQGPEFDSAIVARALGLDPAEIEERLTVLEQVNAVVRRVREHELPDGSLTVTYHFVHVLYQNALYGLLTPTRKAAINAAVAAALIAAYGEASAQITTQLALLLEAAREFGRAADYFLLAAQNAARIFAHHEAVMLSRRGIAMLERAPATPDRTTQELTLQLTLGSQLLATQGYAARALGDAYARARTLCDQIGETPLVLPALLGLSTFHTVRGDYVKGREFSEELLLQAQHFGDTRHPIRAHVMLGVTSCMSGQLSTAAEYFEPCISIDVPRDGSWTSVYGAAPGVTSRGYLALTLLLMGHPDRALTMALDGLTLAHDLSHPLSMASARRYVWWIRQLRREPSAAEEHASALLALSTQQRFAFYRAWGLFERGWGATNPPGNGEAGLREMQDGLAALRETGTLQLSTYMLALLAEAYGKARRPSDALQALDDALAVCERSGETFFESELRRLRGELLVNDTTPDLQHAERCFTDALEIARRQEARWLELRAATSLARLWSHRGNRAEAFTLLNRIYNWLTEGAGVPDLQEAKALLNVLQ